MENEAITSWNAIAQDWTRYADMNDYRIFFLIPETLKLLGDVAGMRLLDLGCGEGGYARLLSKRGALVTAIDASQELISIAEKKAQAENLSITSVVRDAACLDGFTDRSFDIVLAAMSLMDVERYQEVMMEIRRILRPGGKVLMSILHPCFMMRDHRWELEWQAPDEISQDVHSISK